MACHQFAVKEAVMPVVKIKTNRQVTIPKTIFDELGLREGDFVAVTYEQNQLVFKPKKLVDARPALIEEEIAEGLEDIRQGRTYGPFRSAKEMVRSLHQNAKVSKH